MSILTKIFGSSDDKFLRNLQPIVDKINTLEPDLEKLNDEELPKKTLEFKERIKRGESLDDILPEAFALARLAAKKTLNQRHYDVQILGGIILHQGRIAEMKTGEGKTLVATLPVYLNALSGKGVHVVTVNDYLSRRDVVWMGQIYHSLGLSVACVNHDSSFLYDPKHTQTINHKSQIKNDDDENSLDKERDELGSFKVVHEFLRPCSRKEAYEADITYGTNNEFGFDYLRGNMAYQPEQVTQRGYNFAIIDEVDSILIDEARTPLIISAPDEDSGGLYKTFSKIVPQLKENSDYNIDEKMKAVTLTDDGIGNIEKILGIENIYTEGGVKYVHHLEQALRAKTLFQRDRHYVVKNDEVIIVDEFTGRLMPGRRWSDGLHQAVEAKEGVSVQKESRTMASITFQNYFRMYKKLSGMTGTAITSVEEFHKVYRLDVLAIPTNKSLERKDYPDQIFQTIDGKYKAVVERIKKCRAKGQPILVGTVSIEKNEYLSALLKKEGIEHKLLNAKNHEKEGEIIAQAGRYGAVTIATNMAGRGVDIALGGNPYDPEEVEKVKKAGGLYVVGTERHEARRIDNQLRGRAGRQGDPGETQFFVSLEDELMRIFGSDRIKKMMGSFGIPEDQPIENKMVSRALESAQAKIEGFNFDARSHVLEYDDVMNRQRKSIYNERNQGLFGEDDEVESIANQMIKEEIESLIDFHTQGNLDDWNTKEIYENLYARFGVESNVTDEFNKFKNSDKSDIEIKEEIKNYVLDLWKNLLDKKKNEIGEKNFARTLRAVMLQIIDMFWVGHLEAMEYMRSSVRLRAIAQHDPLVEYKNEGSRMFKELGGAIRAQLSHLILKIGTTPLATPRQNVVEIHAGQSAFAKDSSDASFFAKATADKKVLANNLAGSQSGNSSEIGGQIGKVGRNDSCPCGSGKKYKRCHAP